MKRVNITYHMKRGNEIAETCITLPMEDDVSKDILAHGEDSIYLQPGRHGHIRRILSSLATIQGYQYLGACCPEEVK